VQIRVFETAHDLARAVATRIVDELRRNPSAVLGLATGGTPLATYAELRRMHAAGVVDFSHATTFNLDEFAGVPASHPGSFRRYMDVKLFDSVNVNLRRIHFLDGVASDLDAECARYEEQIERCGGIDLQILGIGANGHIGFNEPDETLSARTHRVRLHDQTRRDNAALFGDPSQVPREALSMGMGTILKSRAIVLMATGARKARCVERTVNGPITTRLPASFLQLHRDAELYLDRDAASLLPHPA
jgi:glucosamine-6-phosphate deaminase